MSAKPIIQGQEFPIITPTAIKDIDAIPAEVDKNRVRVVRPPFSFIHPRVVAKVGLSFNHYFA